MNDYQSSYAAFEQDGSGGYAIDVGAQRDLHTGFTSASARGELPGEVYYLALGAGRAVHLTQTLDERLARLDATLHIDSCVNDDGDPITDSRCPVGRSVFVKAVFHGTGTLTHLSDPPSPTGSGYIDGRLGDATAILNGSSLGRSLYAELVKGHSVVIQ